MKRLLPALGCLFLSAVAPFSHAAETNVAPQPPAAPTPAPANAVPAVPKGVAMTANSAESITITWYSSPNNDATSYTVYGSDKTDGEFTRLGSVTERTFTQDKLTPGTNRFFKVSATNANGESAQSTVAQGFSITPTPGAPFPVKVATNMCITLGMPVLADQKPLTGKLADFVDDSDITSCRLRKNCEIKIKLDPAISIEDAAYLLINFRSSCGQEEWSNDRFARTIKNYVVTESIDSTNGTDGTWQEVAKGTNALLDGVIVFPNHKPKWIGLRVTGPMDPANTKPEDRHLYPTDLILCRLNVFRSPPAGFRNDYWIFTGDSLVVQDMGGGFVKGRSAWFSDLIRKQHPERYPIVVHAGRGGEMLKDTQPRMEKIMDQLTPDNGTKEPTGTIVCWETGFNDVGLGGSLGLGNRLIKSYEAAQKMCESKGLIIVPVRIEFSNYSLDPVSMEPTRYNIFYNTLAVNLGGVDVFCRNSAPYACDPKTQLPFADYWTYTRKNYATVLVKKDSVHHTPEGNDGINRLWAEVADKMIYTPQKP